MLGEGLEEEVVPKVMAIEVDKIKRLHAIENWGVNEDSVRGYPNARTPGTIRAIPSVTQRFSLQTERVVVSLLSAM